MAEPQRLLYAVCGAVLLIAYLVQRAYYYRFRQWENYPRPKPSLLWGAMKVMHEHTQKLDIRRHVGKTILFKLFLR